MSLSLFELTFICGVRSETNFILLHVAIQCPVESALQPLNPCHSPQGDKKARGADVGTCSMILEEEVAESRLCKKYLAFDRGHTQSTKGFHLWDTFEMHCINL